ncbi:MAG: flagellar protein FlgN, partial [Cellulosilyticum sp.]|nr:flagellar protein FlgN [Cellulosilyticum sp.]
MAGIIYDLIDVLEEEKECYEGLNTLASYTEHAVVNKNIEFLQEVVKTEEEFTGRISNLEKKRESLMQDIA